MRNLKIRRENEILQCIHSVFKDTVQKQAEFVSLGSLTQHNNTTPTQIYCCISLKQTNNCSIKNSEQHNLLPGDICNYKMPTMSKSIKYSVYFIQSTT